MTINQICSDIKNQCDTQEQYNQVLDNYQLVGTTQFKFVEVVDVIHTEKTIQISGS